MQKTKAIEVLARRLKLNAGRVTSLATAAANFGLLPKSSGRDFATLGSLELSRLVLCAVADRGLGVAGQSVAEFEALATDSGILLGEVLDGLCGGRIAATALSGATIFQLNPAGATFVVNGTHMRFGAEHAAGAAKQTVIPAAVMSAIVLEFRGYQPAQVDEQIAVAKLRAALN